LPSRSVDTVGRPSGVAPPGIEIVMTDALLSHTATTASQQSVLIDVVETAIRALD
jgi:hypothetical protein